MGGTVGVRAPCVGRVSFGLRLVPQQRSLAWPSLANAILGASAFAEESVASRSGVVFGIRLALRLLC